MIMNDSKQDVAILMMLYNHEDLVEESLNSLLAQTDQNFNLLVIDDASSDGSYDVAKNIAPKFRNCIVLKNEKNKGVEGNYFYGLNEIETRFPESAFFLWACPDDTWSPLYLEATKNKLLENENASVCQTGYEMICVQIGEHTEHLLAPVKGRSYSEAKKILLPCGPIGKQAHYNSIIQGMVRFSDLRSVFPADRDTLAAMLCIERGIVVAMYLCGDIEVIDQIYYHRKKVGAFIDKYPEDNFTKGRGSIKYRLLASLKTSFWLLKLAQQKKRSLFITSLLSLKLINSYGIRFFLSYIKRLVVSNKKISAGKI